MEQKLSKDGILRIFVIVSLVLLAVCIECASVNCPPKWKYGGPLNAICRLKIDKNDTCKKEDADGKCSCFPGYKDVGEETCERMDLCLDNYDTRNFLKETDEQKASVDALHYKCKDNYKNSNCHQCTDTENEGIKCECMTQPEFNGTFYQCLNYPSNDGHICTEVQSGCYDEPCKNGGKCTPGKVNASDFTCRCKGDFTGATCGQIAVASPEDTENKWTTILPILGGALGLLAALARIVMLYYQRNEEKKDRKRQLEEQENAEPEEVSTQDQELMRRVLEMIERSQAGGLDEAIRSVSRDKYEDENGEPSRKRRRVEEKELARGRALRREPKDGENKRLRDKNAREENHHHSRREVHDREIESRQKHDRMVKVDVHERNDTEHPLRRVKSERIHRNHNGHETPTTSHSEVKVHIPRKVFSDTTQTRKSREDVKETIINMNPETAIPVESAASPIKFSTPTPPPGPAPKERNVSPVRARRIVPMKEDSPFLVDLQARQKAQGLRQSTSIPVIQSGMTVRTSKSGSLHILPPASLPRTHRSTVSEGGTPQPRPPSSRKRKSPEIKTESEPIDPISPLPHPPSTPRRRVPENTDETKSISPLPRPPSTARKKTPENTEGSTLQSLPASSRKRKTPEIEEGNIPVEPIPPRSRPSTTIQRRVPENTDENIPLEPIPPRSCPSTTTPRRPPQNTDDDTSLRRTPSGERRNTGNKVRYRRESDTKL